MLTCCSTQNVIKYLCFEFQIKECDKMILQAIVIFLFVLSEEKRGLLGLYGSFLFKMYKVLFVASNLILSVCHVNDPYCPISCLSACPPTWSAFNSSCFRGYFSQDKILSYTEAQVRIIESFTKSKLNKSEADESVDVRNSHFLNPDSSVNCRVSKKQKKILNFRIKLLISIFYRS